MRIKSLSRNEVFNNGFKDVFKLMKFQQHLHWWNFIIFTFQFGADFFKVLELMKKGTFKASTFVIRAFDEISLVLWIF